MSKQPKESLSRRAFISAGGAMAAGTVVSALAPRVAEAQVAAPPAPVPWPIPVLDPNFVRDWGYWGYWATDAFRNANYGCAYGVAGALIESIKRGLGPGTPWDTLPYEIFKWGKTGCVESGTLCGALAGALPIFSLAAPMANVEMGQDLLRWYQETALPSFEMDTLDSKRPYPGQAQSMSGSPLCHISVSKWCQASGKTAGSNDRKTRCAKITGDVGKMAATILNRYVPGQKYVKIYPAQPELYAECVKCHVDAPPPPTPDGIRLNNSLGVSNCVTCHPDAQPVMSRKPTP
jgi:Putative redox-active protein (C_GCAxxG_C_C)